MQKIKKHFNHRRGICVTYIQTDHGFVGEVTRIPSSTRKPSQTEIEMISAVLAKGGVNVRTH